MLISDQCCWLLLVTTSSYDDVLISYHTQHPPQLCKNTITKEQEGYVKIAEDSTVIV